jgi:hypothetical protein
MKQGFDVAAHAVFSTLSGRAAGCCGGLDPDPLVIENPG